MFKYSWLSPRRKGRISSWKPWGQSLEIWVGAYPEGMIETYRLPRLLQVSQWQLLINDGAQPIIGFRFNTTKLWTKTKV